jgi:hypothetical protein
LISLVLYLARLLVAMVQSFAEAVGNALLQGLALVGAGLCQMANVVLHDLCVAAAVLLGLLACVLLAFAGARRRRRTARRIAGRTCPGNP